VEKLTIALLSGGDSPERQVSLNSGDQVFEALDKEKYRVIRFDPKTDLAELAASASGIDAALIILHGPMGEDGTLQGMLDLLDIPYQGSGVLGSALAMNKLISKKMYEENGLLVPPYSVASNLEDANPERIARELGLPLVVKPVMGGSSIGMSLVKSVKGIPGAIQTALQQGRSALVESYLPGTELTCAVIGNDHLETYPVVEIRPGENHDFFDYKAKYTEGATTEICPANIPDDISERVKAVAKTAHAALGCRGYSRTDVILSQKDIFVIETNTIPGMTRTSLLPLSAQAAGVDFSSLLDRLILLGLEDYTNKHNIRNHDRLKRILRAVPVLSGKKK
jgi:D-alanine-D-alanine ligase